VCALFTGLLSKSPSDLFASLLERHAQVQRAKPPEGKREWFERGQDGSIFVRVPYRLDERPEFTTDWNRPYRIRAIRSFCADLKVSS
jgi:hypothetical protein